MLSLIGLAHCGRAPNLGGGTDAMTDTAWLTPQQQSAWRAFLRGGRRLMEALDRDLAPYGLGLAEYEILSMLSEVPGQRLRMSELADIVVQSRSRLTHTATRLERRGWVTRAPFPGDGRGVLLSLTPEGLATVQRVAPAHVASVRRVLIDLLPAEQLAALGVSMRIVHDSLCPRGVPPLDEPSLS
jgi:DNA-binding MarR family transcriptional regulator